ncbi:replication factor A protein 2 [Orbilia ellipsospora]|uniref:Replication factor A protein 2 n=1 Tax=Orbilia ellipsospora TaxID=2528407 RepID=A0AAV9XR57_9PEZI
MSYGGYDGGYQTTSYGGGGGGGFMSGSQGGSQASPGKSAAKNTLRPVTIKQIIEAQSPHDDSTFVIDGNEVGNITFIAQIRNVQDQETNTTYKMEDGTGTIEVKQFKDNKSGGGDMDDDGTGASTSSELQVNAYARVTGNIKQFNNKRNIGTQHVRQVTDFNEIQYHFLEATAVHLYFTRGPPESMQARHTGDGAAYQQGGANAYGGDTEMGGAANTAGAGAAMLPPGISGNARKIYSLLKNRSDSSEGMHVSIISQNTKISMSDTYKAVDELLTNGVCFTTMDDEHIACMDF